MKIRKEIRIGIIGIIALIMLFFGLNQSHWNSE